MSTNQFGKQGWTPELMGDVKGKTFLITGANAGTGFQAARILLSKGAQVVMLNRSVERSQQAIAALKAELGTDARVSYVQIDLGNLQSVRSAAEQINAQVENIDALICNGAIAQVAKQELTPDGFESQLGVNHYGHFLLANLIFDKIQQSKGRIVVVASEGYKMGLKTIQFDDMNFDHNYQPNVAYSQSKLAQMMFAYQLQRKISAANGDVKVYVCHPGSSKTSLINKDRPFMTRIMFKLMTYTPMVQSAEKGAYPELMCATQDDLKQVAYYGPTGALNWVGPVGECKLEPHALDESVAARLWEVSEKATNCKWNI